MKISQFSGHADYDAKKPLVFAAEIPGDGQIVDAKIVIGNKSAHLHLTVVHTVTDALKPLKLIGLLLNQEHDEALENEFVMKTRTFKFTSEVPAYYLFTAPRE
jgi:hypothetical protein